MNKEQKGSVLTRLFHVAREGKWQLSISCASAVIGMLAGILPYLSVYFIARAMLMPASENVQGTINFWIVIAGIGIVGNMLFSFLGSFGAHKVAFKILYNFRIRVMEHMGRLSIGFFAKNTTGSIQKTMDGNIEKLEGFIAHMLPDILGSAAVLAVLFGGLFMLNGWLAVTVLVAIIGSMALQFTMFGGKKGKTLWSEVAGAAKDMTGAFSEYVKGIAEVKLFGLTGTITKGLNDNIRKYEKWELRQYKRSAPAYTAYKTIVISLLSFVLPVGVLLISMHPGDKQLMLSLLMALIVTPAVYDPLMTCISYGAQMGQLSVGLDSIDKIMETKPISKARYPKVPDQYDVEFKDVSFSYKEASDPLRSMALAGLSFHAKQNSITALVGPSGGGKSTVGQLLSRFWDVESGEIYIGGINIQQIDPACLMDIVAVVFQDTYIFSDTVLNNITMNHPCSKEQVELAAKAAQCHDFIRQLPDGYNTHIGSGGMGLSGGEAQRISIARAILKNSPIIVLDEALAYSDAENENLIQRAIWKLIENKTVIVVAHRLQSIKDANCIHLLNKGKIIESGTHDNLVARDTEYRELWRLQHEADAWSIKAGGERV